GAKVCLVDAHGIAGGTSGSCQGHLMVTPSPPYVLALTAASVALWRELRGTIADFEFRDTGCLWLAETDDDLPLLDDVAAQFAAGGERAERLDRADLRAREPGLAPDLAGALWYPGDAVVMPMKAAGAMLAAAIAGGCTVRTSCAVTGVRRGADGRLEAVLTEGGAIPTRTLVVCAGVWSPQVGASIGAPAGCLPIFPRRGDLMITTPRGASVRTQVLEVSYLRTAGGAAKVDPESGQPDPGAHAMNLQPQTHDTILIGSTRQFAGFERRVDRELLHLSMARAARYVPSLRSASIVRTWAGLRPYPRDKMPLIGPIPGAPGCFVASGHEGLGITLAPITGKLIAELVTGAEQSLDCRPIAPARFAPREPAHA
ncbi:MAG TPA: FAD-dependent oxidoreductase, partial [Planctomycetota bacterium]|nr:FAD-dependent oxidoreductase [Planctomycetota bacterium]